MLYCTTNILFVSTRPTRSLSSQQNVLQLEALMPEKHTYNIHVHTCCIRYIPSSPTTIARLHWCLNISPSSYVRTYIHAPKSLVCLQQQMNVLLYPIPAFMFYCSNRIYELFINDTQSSVVIDFFLRLCEHVQHFPLSLFFCMYNVHVLRFFLPFPLFLLGVVLFVISHKLQHTHSH